MTVYKVDLKEAGAIKVESDSKHFTFLDVTQRNNHTHTCLMLRASQVRDVIAALENALIDVERSADEPVERMED